MEDATIVANIARASLGKGIHEVLSTHTQVEQTIEEQPDPVHVSTPIQQ